MNEIKPIASRDWTIADLEHWDARIREIVEDVGLQCFPQEFELCDHEQMLGLMSYSGMPSHYPHWSYGKAFEMSKTRYDHGVSGLPYEMVINSNPCLAYLMRDNPLALHVLTIAHVYGHNDFFRNNFTFGFFPPEVVIERFKAHANRVRGYVEDPSIGRDKVEAVLDAAHALAFQCRRNPAIRKLERDEQVERALAAAAPPADPHKEIHAKPDYTPPDLDRVPLEPDEDLLLFIRDHNPRLAGWQCDLLTIVTERTRYFLPQMETKIMNEGWACYWHRHIMNRLELPQDLQMAFLVLHNQVVRPIPGQLNPYHLGLLMWDDIVRRYEKPTPQEKAQLGPDAPSARDAIFAIRESDRDASFLRRFLTPKLMRQLNLFEHGRDEGSNRRVVTRVSDDENWRQIKATLLANIGLASLPTIRVVDSDHEGARGLVLEHDHDGRDLDLGYAENTLRYVQQLWGRKVVLRSRLNGEETLLSHDGEKFEMSS